MGEEELDIMTSLLVKHIILVKLDGRPSCPAIYTDFSSMFIVGLCCFNKNWMENLLEICERHVVV